MRTAIKSPKYVNRTHTSPTQYLFSPQRHSLQIKRLKVPSELNQYIHQRSTHKAQKKQNHDQYKQYKFQKGKFDSNFSDSEESYTQISPIKQKQFLTKNHTPRVTVGRRLVQGRLRSGDREYLIIRKKQNPAKYSSNDNNLSENNIQTKNSNQIAAKATVQNIPSEFAKQQKSTNQNSKDKKISRNQFGAEKQRKSINNSRYIRKFIESKNLNSDRPLAPDVSRSHYQKLPTTVQYQDQECQNTPVESQQFEIDNFQFIPQYDDMSKQQSEENILAGRYELGTVRVDANKQQNERKKSIEARYQEIENILSTQNQNLKQHNQYLVAVVKKMQVKDRMQKHQLHLQERQIKRLSQQRNAYMERCFYLQSLSAVGNRKFGQQVGQQTYRAHHHHSSKYPAHAVKNANFASLQEEEKEQIDGLRQYLQNTIGKQNKKSKLIYQNKHNLQSHRIHNTFSSQALFKHSTGHEVPNPSITNTTPEFISTGESPQRKARLTTKRSNRSNDSDPNNSAILHEDSAIINNSGAGGAWVNTHSGYSLVNGLNRHLRTDEGEQMSDIFEDGSIQMQKQADQTGENAKTIRNSQQVRYTTKADQLALEQLNRKFEQLMKVYKVNHDVAIRKQCVSVAKQMKYLKQQIDMNKVDEESENAMTKKSGSELMDMQEGRAHANTRVYRTNGEYLLTRVRPS